MGTPASASTTLSGVLKGDLGDLDVQTSSAGHVTGTYAQGGACTFDPQRPVLDGEFEGKVLVGTVTLCQTGPACDERAYNILAFYNPGDQTLTADVKLEAGCDSPALKNSRLVLTVSRDEQVHFASQKERRSRGRRGAEECLGQFQRAQRLLEKHDFAGASYYFQQSLGCNDQFWAAHLGLGVAELRRGNVQQAVLSIEKARDLAHAANQDDAGVYYDLACAKARQNDRRQALVNLKRAVELGWDEPAAMSADPDLASLRDDREFKSLLDRAWDLKDRQQKEKSGH